MQIAQGQQLVEPVCGYSLSPQVRKGSQKWFGGGAEGEREGKENIGGEKKKGKGKRQRERGRKSRGRESVIGSILSLKA